MPISNETATIELIKGNKGTLLYRDFWPLLRKIGDQHCRWREEYDLSPFDFHEQAVVGAFVAAAGSLNFLSLNEYQVLKTRGRKKIPDANGRADFWICFGKRNYSLEFKRAKLMANLQNLQARMKSAINDIERVDKDEHDRALAVVTAYISDEHRMPTYRDFAQEGLVDMAVRIGAAGKSGVFIYLKMIP